MPKINEEKMEQITLKTKTATSNITVGIGEIANINSYINSDAYDKVFYIIDETFYGLYKGVIDTSFSSSSLASSIYVFQSCESNKNLSSVQDILEKVARDNCSRNTLFIAMGGGIVCDITGFVAGLWYRGCSVMYIPTTLLSMVDASVGGKCGVDFMGHKNQLGLIIQPQQVIIDPLVLATLPQEIFKDGCAEIIKHAALGSQDMFETLFENPLTQGDCKDSSISYQLNNKVFEIPSYKTSYSYEELEELIAKNIRIKASFVEKDEKDHGIRAALNYGHTFAHALEAATNMELSHGKAVAIGIVFANRLGLTQEITMLEFAQNTEILLQKHNLLDDSLFVGHLESNNQSSHDIIINAKSISLTDVANQIAYDKKSNNDGVNFIFVEKPGSFKIQAIPLQQLQEAIVETLKTK